ncbi:MAG: DNRLRE domain-containing protein, partial [Bacteroidota bacterium]
STLYNFYDAEPGAGSTATLLATATSFDPGTPASLSPESIFVTQTGFPCESESKEVVVNVIAATSATFTAPEDLCVNADSLTGQGSGMPTGGVYSGAGVIDDGNGTTYSFNPATAGEGKIPITYTPAGGCSAAVVDTVEVFGLPPVTLTIPAAQDTFCIAAAAVVITLAGSPPGSGGEYDGPGVTNIGDGVNFIFTPGAAGVGQHIITYTITDGNGCMNSATDTIWVLPPPSVTFTAPADLCINENALVGLGGGVPTGGTYGGSGVTDGADGMTYSFDPAAANIGVHVLTYTFTDASGCTNMANDDIEVFDTTALTLNITDPALCVDDESVTLSGGTPTGGVYMGVGVTNDGNGTSFGFDPTAVAPGGGDVTITYELTNPDFCVSTATQDIFVDPNCNQPPMAVCRADTVYSDHRTSACTFLPDATDFDGGSFDLDGDNLSFSISPTGPFSDGTSQVILTVDDGLEMSSCTTSITVIDTVPPTIEVNFMPDTLFLDATGFISIANFPSGLFQSSGSSFSDCNLITNIPIVSPASFDCDDLGMASLSLSLTDGSGNTATLDTFVILVDTISPVVTSISDTTLYLDASGMASFMVEDVVIDTTENCTVANVELFRATDLSNLVNFTGANQNNRSNAAARNSRPVEIIFDCDDVGTVAEIVVVATDQSGNTDTTRFNATVLDTVPPTLTCPLSDTIYLPMSGDVVFSRADFVNEIGVTADDNCPAGLSNILIPGGSSNRSFACGDANTVRTVSFTVRDASSNQATCMVSITTLDTIPPTLSCRDTTIFLDEDGVASVAPGELVEVTDNCPITPSGVANPLVAFDCSFADSTVVFTEVRMDDSGNQDSCAVRVTVLDTIRPTIECVPITVALNGSGMAPIDLDMIIDTVFDNCSTNDLLLSISKPVADCADLGDINVIVSATDPNRNETINDFVGPFDPSTWVFNTLSGSPLDQAFFSSSTDTLSLRTSSDDDCDDPLVAELTKTIPVDGRLRFDYAHFTDDGELDVFLFDLTGAMDTIIVIEGDFNTLQTGSVEFEVKAGDMLMIVLAEADGCFSTANELDITNFQFIAEGETSSCEVTVTVIDTIAPDIGSGTTIVFRNGLENAGGIYAGTEDTYIQENMSTMNFGNENFVNPDNFSLRHGLIQFKDIFGNGPGQVPNGAVITSAALVLRVFDSGSEDIEASRILGPWDESVATWDNFMLNGNTEGGAQRDDVETTAATTFTFPPDDEAQFIDVTSDVQFWSDNGNNFGWALFNPSDDGLDFRSSEFPNQGARPRLRITYILPDAPVPCEDVTVFAPPSSCDYTAVGNELNPLAVDNCSIDQLVNDFNGAASLAGATFPIDTTLVSFVATDPAGNSDSCSFNVIVQDTVPPVLTCLGNATGENVIINGSFETGDFTAWVAINNPDPFIPWEVDASEDDFFGGNATPTQGSVLAYNGFDGEAGEAVLYQEVIIPPGGELSWDENIDYDLATFTLPTMVRIHMVEIQDLAGNTLATLHEIMANPGDIEVDNAWVSYSFDVSAFAGQNVRIAFKQTIPEDFSGPGAFAVDNVMLSGPASDPLFVYLDDQGLASVAASDLVFSVFDNCGEDPSSPSYLDGSAAMDYDCSFVDSLVTDTIVATDLSGNQSTCSVQFTVLDTVPPSLSCPLTDTIFIPASGDTVISREDFIATLGVVADDNCADGLGLILVAGGIVDRVFDCDDADSIRTVTLEV